MMNIKSKSMLKIILSSIILIVTASHLQAEEINLAGRLDQDMKRDQARKPVQIINYAGVKTGDKVLDLLGGGGYYSELLSRKVGDKGEVVLQIPEAYLKYVEKTIDQRLANDRLKNVTYLLSEAPDLKLGTEKYDSVFLVLGYHDMFNKSEGWDFDADTVMPQVIKSMKSGGNLLIIDHNTTNGQGKKDTDSLHRIEAEFTKVDLLKRGFLLVSESSILKNTADDHTKSVFDKTIRGKTDRFVMLFEKP